jgi:hypothetical protein
MEMGDVMKRLIGLVLLAALAGCVQNNVFELAVGACFDDEGDLSDEVSEVPIVECSDPHDNEVFAVHEMLDSAYPGFDEAGDRADGLCREDFEPFVGVQYEVSELDIGWLIPTDLSWANGDREIVCFLYRVDLEKMTGTMEGSRT